MSVIRKIDKVCSILHWGLPWWLRGKETTCKFRRHGFSCWVGKIPWRREWQPTPVFLPGKSHEQRSLANYSPWGCKTVGYNLAAKQSYTGIYMVTKMSYSYIYLHGQIWKTMPWKHSRVIMVTSGWRQE